MPKLCTSLISIVCFLGCNPAPKGELNEDEISYIRATMQEYREAWLDDDTAKVMNTLSEDVILFIPGNTSKNIAGKSAVKDFWFPPSDTKYPIKAYEISDEQIYGCGKYATAQGRSLLTWETIKGDSLIATDTAKSDYLTILRKEETGWKICRQMFQVRE